MGQRQTSAGSLKMFEQHTGLRSDKNEIIDADHGRRTFQWSDAHPTLGCKQTLIDGFQSGRNPRAPASGADREPPGIVRLGRSVAHICIELVTPIMKLD
jgi:hypothetical protein